MAKLDNNGENMVNSLRCILDRLSDLTDSTNFKSYDKVLNMISVLTEQYGVAVNKHLEAYNKTSDYLNIELPFPVGAIVCRRCFNGDRTYQVCSYVLDEDGLSYVNLNPVDNKSFYTEQITIRELNDYYSAGELTDKESLSYWIADYTDDGTYIERCSSCRYEEFYNLSCSGNPSRFCPHCGARMSLRVREE